MPCWQQDRLLLTVPRIYSQIYHRTPIIKNKVGVGIFKILQKKRIFYLLWQPSAHRGNLTMCPSSCTFQKKAFLSPSVCPIREYTWTLNWKKSLLICFENCQDVPYSHRQSRKRMMSTIIIVNITPRCKR